MGEEMNFYGPFNMDHCGYEFQMSCLDPKKKLIAYRKESTGKLVPMHYFLRWINPGASDSEWVIYHTISDHQISKVDSDAGFVAHQRTVSDIGIPPGSPLGYLR